MVHGKIDVFVNVCLALYFACISLVGETYWGLIFHQLTKQLIRTRLFLLSEDGVYSLNICIADVGKYSYDLGNINQA